MSKLNFNEILWEAPEYEGVSGFLPSDKFYKEICEWLKSMKDVHRYKVDNETHVMKEIPDSDYNVVASFNHENKMIHYHFQRKFEYFI